MGGEDSNWSGNNLVPVLTDWNLSRKYMQGWVGNICKAEYKGEFNLSNLPLMVLQGKEVEPFHILSSLLSKPKLKAGINSADQRPRWSTNLVFETNQEEELTKDATFKVFTTRQGAVLKAEQQNWRGDLKNFVSWLLFGVHLVSCYFVDSSILLWSGLMSTFQQLNNGRKYFKSYF